MINTEILNSVGSKAKADFLAGKITQQMIMNYYIHNKQEVENFNPYGLSKGELLLKQKAIHNPLLRARIIKEVASKHEKSISSRSQNELSLRKLSYYTPTALGIGIRKAIKELKRIAKTGDAEAKILAYLMEAEFANLSAKKNYSIQKSAYSRKQLLLEDVSDLLYEYDWKCGVSTSPGKNAAYLIYVYLPNGIQLSWHSNDYRTLYYYKDIDCEWDGQKCATMEKLLEYAHERYEIGNKLKRYQEVA